MRTRARRRITRPDWRHEVYDFNHVVQAFCLGAITGCIVIGIVFLLAMIT